MGADRYKYFRVEAVEILDHLGRGALALEKAEGADVVSGLLRLAHTLKGAARVVREREVADAAHAIEDTLEPYRVGGAVPRDRVDRVLALVDDIARRVALLGAGPDVETPAAAAGGGASAVEAPAASAEATIVPAAELDPVATAVRPATDDLDRLLGHVFEAQVRLGGLRPALARLADVKQAAAAATGHVARVAAGGSGGAAMDVRVDGAGGLPDLVGGLERQLSSGLEQIDRELRQVREAAERLRLAPVSKLFTFLGRAVRDAANALAKTIALDATGGDVRVDAAVLTIVQGALLHLVRNAATHGIEAPADRLAAGKPAEGRIRIAVEQRGRRATFTCADDGRGVDLDAIRAAVERRSGTVDPGLDAGALLRALLRGGISTSGAVTDLSGRGIGLDAVREAAARLGGEVAVHTDAGRGTTFTLTVPVSIASLPALVVEAGGSTIALPLDAVRRGVRLDRDDVVRTEQHDTVLVDGEAVPLAPLARIVAPGAAAAPLAARSSMVVVRGRTASAAFVVDRIVGSEAVILTPLPALAPASPVIAGAALDPVGDPLLVVDPDELVAAAGRASFSAAETPVVRPPVLVIDDSLTTRMLEQSILEAAGYEVDLATSAEEGLDKARRGHYALFLVDVEMPGMDGFTFVERVRADPALAHVPAILVTSRSSPEDRQRGLAAGAQAYIVKGEFDQSALLERLKVLIG